VDRGDIPIFQVGKGEDMSSIKSLRQQGELTDEEEAEERPRSDEDSHEIVSRVNEDDEKLKTSTIKEKDQRSVMVIGGVKIFLPSSQGEANTYIAIAREGHQAETIVKEEMRILRSVPIEENLVELLAQWELELKELEDWLGTPGPEGCYQEIAMTEETHQHELQLEEDGQEQVKELKRVNLLEVINELKPSDEETAGVKVVEEWQAKATRDEEYNMGYRCLQRMV
jgi:hypothetical protein